VRRGRIATAVADARSQAGGGGLRVERHHAAVLVDPVLAQRRELDDQVDTGQDLLSESGEHVFVKLGGPADGLLVPATYLARRDSEVRNETS
jgi:hypothetical protein